MCTFACVRVGAHVHACMCVGACVRICVCASGNSWWRLMRTRSSPNGSLKVESLSTSSLTLLRFVLSAAVSAAVAAAAAAAAAAAEDFLGRLKIHLICQMIHMRRLTTP